MLTIDFIRRKSREPDFPLQVAGAGLLTALGGPLVIGPALGVIAIDALCSVVKDAPRVLGAAANIPLRAIEDARRSSVAVAEERHLAVAAQVAEGRRASEAEQRKREARIILIDARSEVVRFYESQRQFLQDAIPPALFRSQLQIRFPDSLSRSEAWETARDMITEMLPLATAGRERAEEQESADRRRSGEIRAKRREIRRLQSELEQLLSSDIEPELSEPEARSLREEIRELQNELEAMEDEAWGNPS